MRHWTGNESGLESAILEVLYSAGLRVSELAALDAADADPETPATVTRWLREPDPGRRVGGFAEALREDFAAQFRREVAGDPRAGEFTNTVIALAWERTDWRKVAAAVLRHFTTPVTLAA